MNSFERFVGSRNGLLVVGEVEKHSLAKPLLAWRDPSPMPVQGVELTFVGVEGRYVLIVLVVIGEVGLVINEGSSPNA